MKGGREGRWKAGKKEEWRKGERKYHKKREENEITPINQEFKGQAHNRTELLKRRRRGGERNQRNGGSTTPPSLALPETRPYIVPNSPHSSPHKHLERIIFI